MKWIENKVHIIYIYIHTHFVGDVLWVKCLEFKLNTYVWCTLRLLWKTYICTLNSRHFTRKTSLTYLLTPWCRVLLEKLTGLQLVKKFPAFHGTRRFITALTSVRQLSLSCASPIRSIYPHPTYWRSFLILSTHLRLGLPSCLFPSGFPTKTLYAPLSSAIRATWRHHLQHVYILYSLSSLPDEYIISFNIGNCKTTRARWKLRIGTTTKVLILYIFPSLYIFVTWRWPTVAETCRQPNK